MATTPSGESNNQLARRLGLFALIAFGVGDILGSGVYANTGKIAATVGGGAWLSYLTAAVVAGLTGLTYAEYVSRYPRAGGAAHYVASTYRRPWLTFLVIFFVTFSGLFSVATAARTLAIYANPLWPNAPHILSHYLVPLLYLCAVGMVVARGIHLSSQANTVCAVVEVSALLLIIAVAIPFFADSQPFQFNDSGEAFLIPGAGGLVLNGAALAFFAFVGFEDVANMAEEAKDPERNMPIAIIASVAITSVIYCLIAFSVTSILSQDEIGARAPVEALAKAAPWFPIKLYTIIPAFAVFNTGLANLIMASRLLYGMSRGEHRQLPARLAYVHPRWHTPTTALVVVLIITALIICVLKDVSTLAGGVTSFLLIVFGVLHLGLITIKLRKTEQAAPRFSIPIVVPVLGLLTCVVLMFSRSLKDYLVAGLMVVAGLALFAWNWYVLKRQVLDVPDEGLSGDL